MYVPRQYVSARDFDEPAGLHPVPFPSPCRDKDHRPSKLIEIQPGWKFVHYCPACHEKTVLLG